MTAKRLLALTLAGGLIAAGAALWLGRSAGAPSPSGTLAFSSPEESDVVVAAADGSGLRRLTSTPGPQFDPSFSPDGRRIAYRDSRRGINRDDEIWVMNADGSHAVNLTRNSANDWSPAWSPDGGSIAFASTRSGALNLWTMATDGSRAERLTSSLSEYPSWSPDSSRIAFSMLSAGPVQIGVIDRDGGRERTLTPITENSELPAWSPDGSQIAFCRGFEGHRAVWIMRADGTDAHRLTSAGSDDVGPDLLTGRSLHRLLTPRQAHDHALRRIRQPAGRRTRHASSVDARATRSRKLTHRTAALRLCAISSS